MSTKFVSKNSNYMIVLRPGIEGNRSTGTHAIPGLYIKFQAGVVDVKEDSIVEMLRNHPGCGTDFIEVKQSEIDPFIDSREDIEPPHVMSEIKYGHSEKTVGSGGRKMKLTPQMKRIVESEALKMLPSILKSNPKILKDIILELAADMKKGEIEPEKQIENNPVEQKEEEKGVEEVKKGPGRPPKVE